MRTLSSADIRTVQRIGHRGLMVSPALSLSCSLDEKSVRVVYEFHYLSDNFHSTTNDSDLLNSRLQTKVKGVC